MLKNYYALGLLMCFCTWGTFAQVGIGTTEPTSMLDVDGGIRIRITDSDGLRNSRDQEIQALFVIGVDDEGNFIQVKVDENLTLQDNELRAYDRKKEVGDVPDFNTNGRVNNASLLIWPGGANGQKAVIRLRNSQGDLEFTGIAGGEDGMVVWLYPTDGDLELKRNSTYSDPENRFELQTDVDVEQYSMVQLMYDGTIQRWVLMHFDSRDNND
ncbi:hypothetical protein [Altibacter sp. HG106]|uniref:hypothetical protein n=1 Tax=Altibacter sp. HG106 TaxID=3023937 RepID=UPI00235099C1|nr:hypothetical protein [Altibacter sp. HG106]MDC7996146.1 hypothetical protein [Altibacter sp. HG106]